MNHQKHQAWVAQVESLAPEAQEVYLGLCAAQARYVLTGRLRQAELGVPAPRNVDEYMERIQGLLEAAGIQIPLYVPRCTTCRAIYPAGRNYTQTRCGKCVAQRAVA